MLYTFDFIAANDQIDHIDIAELADDREAERAARAALIRSSVAVGVTVWERSRRVASIVRSGRRPWQSSLDSPSRGPQTGAAWR